MNDSTIEMLLTGVLGTIFGLFLGRTLYNLGVSWQWVAVIVFFGAIIVGMLIGYALHYRNK